MAENVFRIAVRKYDPFASTIRKIWNSFCELTGCEQELDLVQLELHPLYDSILKDKGLLHGDWDVSLINTDWIAEAYSSQCIEELTSFISEDPPEGFPDAWSRSLLYKQEFNRGIYGLPFHNGPECLIYRKDLFDSHEERSNFRALYNRDLEIPKTWNEFIEVAQFFNRPSEGMYGTTFAAFPDGHNTVFDFCLQLWTRGGDLFDENQRIKINSSFALEGMEFYREALNNEMAIHPESRNFDSVKAGQSFANGNLAMMVNWFGFASMCEVIDDSKVKGKVDIANVPKGPKGEGISLNAYWMYVIGKGSEQKSLGYDFIKFAINSSNDKLLTLEGGIGCRKSTWYDQEVNQIVPYYHKLEELHKNTRSLPRKDNWSAIADVIDQLVLDVINTKSPLVTILNKAQDKIDRIETV